MKSKKPTPSQLIKGLKETGWYSFAEWMIAHGYSAYDLEDSDQAIRDYKSAHASLFLARKVERDLFGGGTSFQYGNTTTELKMVGLSEQLAPKKTNKNKMVRRGQYR